MSTLLLFGNINQYAFANSIVAANWKSLKNFNEPLTNIYVIHSSESYSILHQKNDWLNHITKNNIPKEVLIHRIIEIEFTLESIEKFTKYIETIINGMTRKNNLIVDLTNGTTLHKTLLTTVAYILDLKNLYMVDIIKLSQLTGSKEFLNPDILDLCYIQAPDNTNIDNIAYLNLTEVIRYKRIIETFSEKYSNINLESSDKDFFRDNLAHSIHLKLSGDQIEKSDNAIYRIASSSISASLEDLVRIFIDKFIKSSTPINTNNRTFGQNLNIIQSEIERGASSQFDFEFFRRFNDFMLYLRNSTIHKGKILTDVERFKADLSVKMAFPFIQFYTEIVCPELMKCIQNKSPIKINKLSSSDINSNETLYYGLDGDDTGEKLENLFLSSRDESTFKELSKSVENAIQAISIYIKNHKPKGSILFAAGDDILFKGQFAEEELKKMQKIYQDKTRGFTCSIGYGKSFKEVYLAMKVAKTEPGKNSIVGVKIE